MCVRTGTAGLSLVSVVTTVLASDHRAAVLYRSECNLCYRIERWVMFGEGGMHATQQCRKVVFYNNLILLLICPPLKPPLPRHKGRNVCDRLARALVYEQTCA